jgi:drug/metabolite transporter (DMT)-like permease
MFAALLTTVLFALSALAGRRLPHFFSGTQANLFRLILAASLLGIWAHAFGFGLGGAAFPWLFLSGAAGFGLGDLAMLQTYPRLGARRTMVIIQCLAVPVATLLEWAWLGHAPTLGQTGFAILILAGVGLAMLPNKKDEPTHGLKAGLGFGLLAALGQGGGAVLSRKAYAVAALAGQIFHGAGDGINAAYQRMIGGIFVTVLMWLYLKATRGGEPTRQPDWNGGWLWLVAAALAGPSLGVSCFQWALMTEKTSIVLPIAATSPLLVIPLTRWVDGERITKRGVIGGLIAVAGVIGLTLAR